MVANSSLQNRNSPAGKFAVLAPEPGLAGGFQTGCFFGIGGWRTFAARAFGGGLGRAVGAGDFLGGDETRA